MKTLFINTKSKNELIDITINVQSLVLETKKNDGFVYLFVPHTTAAITINENADPDVKRDILFGLSRIVPNLKEFEHFEGNSDAHIKSSLIGVELMLPFVDKKLILGTWQGIYFCEFDGPRNRKVHVLIP